jgi:hypothetical protein
MHQIFRIAFTPPAPCITSARSDQRLSGPCPVETGGGERFFILAGAMKRMLILAVTLWLGVSATAHAQVSSLVGTQPNPQISVQQVESPANTMFSSVAPVKVPCPFGVSLSANLTAFGCASDPLSAPTYHVPAEEGLQR